MKMKFKKSLYVAIASVGFALASQLRAQTLTTLYSFTSTPGFQSGTNSDGANPFGSLVLSGDTLYGTAQYGGSAGYGTLFGVNTDGSQFMVLHNFIGPHSNDGAKPNGGLLLSGNVLYGVTVSGGFSFPQVFGTVFSINTDGTGPTILYAFGLGGGGPQAGLTSSGGTLYGTTISTVFTLQTDGTGFTTLHSASGTDGIEPYGALILSGSTLYGTTYQGGTSSNGTVFAVNTDGTGYTLLHSFTQTSSGPNFSYTNSDGTLPRTGLAISGNALYGVAGNGGVTGAGTVFTLNIDGTGFKVLYTFSGGSDGAIPTGLILSGETLYGTTGSGGLGNGTVGNGTVFSIKIDSTGFTTLYSFNGTNDGTGPEGGLIISSNTLYGMTTFGGSGGTGTVFGLSLMPQLTITQSGANVIVTWPTNFTGFTLQSSTNLASPVWATNLPAPVVVNGVNTVLNPVSGSQQFFRLSQ